MGLYAGSFGAVRFPLQGSPRHGWERMLTTFLLEHAFMPPVMSETVQGWVQQDDPLGIEFQNPNSWLVNGCAFLQFREDAVKLPSARVKATIEQAKKNWCKEAGIEKCPPSVKRELKDKIIAEWRATTRHTMKVAHVVLDLQADEEGEGMALVVITTSDAVAEMVRSAISEFLRTIDVNIAPAQEATADMKLFLPWLWYAAETDLLPLGLGLLMGSKVGLRSNGETNSVFSGEQSTSFAKGRVAAGDRVKKIEITIKPPDSVANTVVLTEGSNTLRGIKLGAAEEEEDSGYVSRLTTGYDRYQLFRSLAKDLDLLEEVYSNLSPEEGVEKPRRWFLEVE